MPSVTMPSRLILRLRAWWWWSLRMMLWTVFDAIDRLGYRIWLVVRHRLGYASAWRAVSRIGKWAVNVADDRWERAFNDLRRNGWDEFGSSDDD